jgi:hypothetical protein
MVDLAFSAEFGSSLTDGGEPDAGLPRTAGVVSAIVANGQPQCAAASAKAYIGLGGGGVAHHIRECLGGDPVRGDLDGGGQLGQGHGRVQGDGQCSAVAAPGQQRYVLAQCADQSHAIEGGRAQVVHETSNLLNSTDGLVPHVGEQGGAAVRIGLQQKPRGIGAGEWLLVREQATAIGGFPPDA